MLPGLPGEDIVRLIRTADAHTPIVVTSARTSATDKVNLLKLGADDYLAKPFDLDELLARIEVQLRHRGRALASQPGGDCLLYTSSMRSTMASSMACLPAKCL